jgi:LytS/YehU family sensor histidine kinase
MSRLSEQLSSARFAALQAQLNPHFLFNTLNTIAEMVHEDADKADAMIAGLSDLLRRTLDLGNTQAIPLRDELDLVSRYLDIQRSRFGDRLQVTLTIDAAAAEARVPPLLLQPIVENAIRHGLAARLDAGRIDLEAYVHDDTLRLVVTDDGSGETGEVIAGPERLGLGNTRARLEALYGGRATLDLSPVAGRGARVTIHIPR